MKINLKTLEMSHAPMEATLELAARLPEHVHSPCCITCTAIAEKKDHYYRLTIAYQTALDLTCQRCLAVFKQPFTATLELCVCDNEADAEQLMNEYDVVVAERFNVDLIDLLTDELILSAPTMHAHEKDCDSQVIGYFSEKSIN